MTQEQRQHIWIVTEFDTECAGCDRELAAGSHILWLPREPRGQNNFCPKCGTPIAGSYPPDKFWERRDEVYRQRQQHIPED